MTVISGSQGGLKYKGASVTARAWTLNTTQETRDTTDLSQVDRTFIYGEIDGTGETTVLYDPDDAAAVEMLNSVFLDDPSEESITFTLNGADGVQYEETGFLVNVSSSVQVGQAHACRVRFQLSDTRAIIQITGPDEVVVNLSRQYFSAVSGVPANFVVSYEWTAVGAIFDDNTAQNPVVTFDSPGEVTLRVTATLADQTTISDELVVTVSQDPVAWVSRMKTPQVFGSDADDSALVYDDQTGLVFFMFNVKPLSGEPNYMALVRSSVSGTVDWVKKIAYSDGTDFNGRGFTKMIIHPVTRDLIVLLSNNRTDQDLFRITQAGQWVYCCRGDQNPSGGVTYKNISATSDGKYVYDINDNNIGQVTENLNVAFFDADNPTGGVARQYWMIDDSNVGDPTSTTVMSDNRIVSLGPYQGFWYLVEFEPDFGGDLNVACTLASAQSYSQLTIDSEDAIVETGSGYLLQRGGQRWVNTMIEMDPQFNPWRAGAYQHKSNQGNIGITSENILRGDATYGVGWAGYGPNESSESDQGTGRDIVRVDLTDSGERYGRWSYLGDENFVTTGRRSAHSFADSSNYGLFTDDSPTSAGQAVFLTYHNHGKALGLDYLYPAVDDGAPDLRFRLNVRDYTTLVPNLIPDVTPSRTDIVGLSFNKSLDGNSWNNVGPASLGGTALFAEITDVTTDYTWETAAIFP